MSRVLRYMFTLKTTNGFLCRSQRNCTSNGDISDLKANYKQLSDLKKYLMVKNIKIKDGYTCLRFECRLCILKNGHHLAYINKKTGKFLCPRCDVKKDLSDIAQLYEQVHKRKFECTEYHMSHRNLTNVTEDVCNAMKITGLTVDDFNALGTLYNAESNTLHFPLKNAVNLIVGEKVLNLSEKTEETFQKPISSGLLLYGSEKTKAVVASNVVDFLAIMAQHLENHAVVCLPYFLKFIPQECLPTLENFNELLFWFSFDSPGWDAAHSISQKLNEKRCLLIRPTTNEPNPYNANSKHLDIRNILKKAMPIHHKSITSFGALRQDILSELQNIDKVNGVKWKRFPVLNKFLKGFRRGELTIITGPTGSGKTTFISEYSLDLALQGVSTLWGSFEIRNSRLASTLLQQFVGYSLEKKLYEFNCWADELEKYPLYFMTFHGQQSIKVVMEAIEHAQYVFDISHVIIDNLQFMMGVSGSHKKDIFWEQDEIIACFRSFATKLNVHVTLVMHPRKEKNDDDLTISSVFGSAKATQEADNVLIIQDKRSVSGKGKKYLQIVKNRYSGDLGRMALEFNKEALSFSDKNKIYHK